MRRPIGTFGTWPGSSVCTPMLVLVRLQRHYIADCDTPGSLVVLTSGDCLVTAVCSQETVAVNRFKSTRTNANVEWPPLKEQAVSSSRRHSNTQGPPHTKATPHQGFKEAHERLGPIPGLPILWNSQGLNCPSLPAAACIISSNCISSVTRGFRDDQGALRILNL